MLIKLISFSVRFACLEEYCPVPCPGGTSPVTINNAGCDFCICIDVCQKCKDNGQDCQVYTDHCERNEPCIPIVTCAG